MIARAQCPAPTIDVLADETFTFAQAARLIPKKCRPSPTTLWRWSTRGKRGVVLPTVPTSSGAVTTKAAIRWFFAELQNAPTEKQHRQSRPGTKAERDALSRECAEAGI